MTRRSLIAGAALLSAAGTVRAAPARVVPRNGPMFAYIGSYTDASTPAGHGEGISLLHLDPRRGAIQSVKVLPAPSPSWLAVDPNEKFLYAINEIDSFGPGKTGSVTAYSLDRSTGNLTQLNAVSSRGKGPAHGSVHPSGKFVFVANYGTGNVAVLPVQADGSLGEALDVEQDDGPHGAGRPAEGPPGNFSISDHDGPHAHMIAADPTGRFVLVNDLGLDRTFVWKLESGERQAGRQRPGAYPCGIRRCRPEALRIPSQRACSL